MRNVLRIVWGASIEKSQHFANSREVRICKFAHIGANTIVYPGCSIGEGTVVGAMSMVRKSLDAWGVYIGIPAKFLKNRNKNMQSLIYGKE